MFSLMNRRSLLVALGIVTAGAGPALSQAVAPPKPEVLTITPELVKAAQAEGEVYFRYSAQQLQTQDIVAQFTKKYGIKVTLDRKVRAEGTEQFATEERAGKHIVDVHLSTDRPGYLKLMKEGLYAPWTIPDVDKRFLSGTVVPSYAIAPYWTRVVLSYNPARLSTADAVKLFDNTWNGLLDPKMKGGHIGIVDPTTASQSALWYWALDESPKYGPEFLKKVAAQAPIIYKGSAAAREGLASGEVDILIGDVEEPNVEGFVKGEKIRWVYPDLLPAFAVVTHFLSAKAPHPNAAKLFLAWTMSDEGAEAIQHAGRVPTLATIQGDKRPQIEALGKVDWWKAFPPERMFSPTFEAQDAKYSEYEKKMLDTFR
jgi:iron(III) transport system substrate-binding protein